MARRRLTTSSEEWADENAVITIGSQIEEEDRRSGQFPYDQVQRIPDFYRGKDILITGALGFIGKVLIEKMLRSLPEGGRLFLLLRGKRGLSADERLQKMLQIKVEARFRKNCAVSLSMYRRILHKDRKNRKLFQEIVSVNPECVERLVVVEGDCGAIGLGLSKADRQMLIDNVSIVFHCAAVVRFDFTNSQIILNNTRGTREVVYLCKEIKKLAAFVHVSTTYCNTTYDKVNTGATFPEEVVPENFDWRTAIAIAEKTERDTQAFNLLFNKFAPNHVVNYAFSKRLAENMIEDECQNIPAVIVRPPVVIATYEDPFPGWVDNLYGPMSQWDGASQGILRTAYGSFEAVLDYIPVDFCVKSIIAAAWHRGLGYRISQSPKKVDVINSSVGTIAKHTFGKLHEKMQILYDKNSHRYIFRYPRLHMTTCYFLYWFIVMTSHIPLGILIDTALRLAGRKPILMSIYRRLHFANVHLLHFYQTNSFSFDNRAFWITQTRIPKEDRDLFCFITKLFTMDYYNDNIRGIIENIFKEKSYSADQNNRRIMYVVDWIQNAFLFLVGTWILYSWILPKMITSATW